MRPKAPRGTSALLATSLICTIVGVALISSAISQQRPPSSDERASAMVANRIGSLTIDNARLATAVEDLLAQLQKAQADLTACKAPEQP